MTEYGLPLLATIALWWRAPERFFMSTACRAGLSYGRCWGDRLALFALWAFATAARRPRAAYGAFSYGLIIWGWQIVSYYTGFITGPRKTACPPETRGLARFIEAIRTSLYHELAR